MDQLCRGFLFLFAFVFRGVFIFIGRVCVCVFSLGFAFGPTPLKFCRSSVITSHFVCIVVIEFGQSVYVVYTTKFKGILCENILPL